MRTLECPARWSLTGWLLAFIFFMLCIYFTSVSNENNGGCSSHFVQISKVFSFLFFKAPCINKMPGSCSEIPLSGGTVLGTSCSRSKARIQERSML